MLKADQNQVSVNNFSRLATSLSLSVEESETDMKFVFKLLNVFQLLSYSRDNLNFEYLYK